MSARIVARIRPQQQSELEQEIILNAASDNNTLGQQTLKIPNPKNGTEVFAFQFHSIYNQFATQQQIFDNEVSPTIKHLFDGLDVTIFAYGSTGTGKTHTMRGGKTLAERGIIPRLLSGIYRKARKIDKDSAGKTTVQISLSYYEIYNDKVFDLLETPEKRTLAGLPLRENGGKTVVVGLTERSCENLKEFEKLYDRANKHRSTSATKLNAVSSRSHAILGIRLAVTTDDEVRMSTASAIDLAGSEDNRRTDNAKERMVESVSINKSLFVLAKCVEAIGSNSAWVPYRESKMTRILSLGQNNGVTIMVLNLAPTKPFQLDTLSSLNFANRTKKIEIREIENEPVYKGCSRPTSTVLGKTIDRQPLRPLGNTFHSSAINAWRPSAKQDGKQAKAFSVYSDRTMSSIAISHPAALERVQYSPSLKRPLNSIDSPASRPNKRPSPPIFLHRPQQTMSKEIIEDLIEKKVNDILATRALDQPAIASQSEISKKVQRRLELLEEKIHIQDDGRGQGLTLLLMAKQHAVRGEDASALKMYTLAKAYFPENRKLDTKIEKLQRKTHKDCHKTLNMQQRDPEIPESIDHLPRTKVLSLEVDDETYQEEEVDDQAHESDQSFRYNSKAVSTGSKVAHAPLAHTESTPRTKQLLQIINRRDVAQIRLLRGVGIKKAEAIVKALCQNESNGGISVLRDLGELERLRGVSRRTIEAMRSAL